MMEQATVVITVYEAPTVNAGSDQSICSTETHTLSASLGGSATSGTWSKSGDGSFNNNSVNAIYTPGSNDISNGTVTLTYTTNDPTGPCNSISDSLILTIKEAVVISTQPSNTGVCVNDNASLSVVAFGDITGYQWYKSIDNGNNFTVVSGATSNVLNFSPASLSDAGSYYVKILGDSPCADVNSDEVTLNVNQLISITNEPDALDLCEGTTANFTVAATGGIASYQWRKDGVNLSNGGDVSRAMSATLTISNVSVADEADYDVVIVGLAGNCPNVISSIASLNVTLQPTANIAYDQAAYCKSSSAQNVIWTNTANGYSGGVFTSVPSGLSINSSTGVITPGSSNPGTYTITYTIPTSTCTVVNPTATVIIYEVSSGGVSSGYLDYEVSADARTVITACHLGDGFLNLSGYTGDIDYWQYSHDGGVTWTTISGTGGQDSITYDNIAQATAYRAKVSSGICSEAYSNATIVNIIPPDVKPTPVTAIPTVVCLGGSSVFTAESGLGTGLGLDDGGGDFNTGQLNTQDPDSWLVDGNPRGWTANGDNTKPNDWSGTNPHPFPGGITYDTGVTSGPKKFGIANGPLSTVLETPIFNSYGLTVLKIELDQAWHLEAGDNIKIELSIDGGASYNVTLQDIDGANDSGNHDNFRVNHFEFTQDIFGNSLENYLGQPNLRVRLSYTGNHYNSAWAIDNLHVEVDPGDNGIEWRDETDTVISTEHTATVTPPFPGVHTYGVTSLIDGCRSEGVDGTVFVDVSVNFAYAGEDQVIPQANCGTNSVTLNAYDNTLTASQNFAKGAYDAYDASHPLGNQPGTGEIGTWSELSGPAGCLGGSFSDVNDPDATFTGDAGTYVLQWDVNGCLDTVSITLTTCDQVDFDGINDHVNFDDNYGLNGTFSIEAWIKTELNSSGIQTIISKRDGNSLSGNGYDLRLQNRRISFNWNNGGSIKSNYNINRDRCYHVGVTFDGSDYSLYIDGIKVVNDSSGSAPAINSFDCLLGAMDSNVQPRNYFNGWIDELRIWNKALDPDHIHQMMNQQIVQNGGSVRGEILPIDIHGPDNNNNGTDDDILTWANLEGYYRMDNIGCGNLLPYNAVGVDGKLKNINSPQPDSAPLPYTTIANGDWQDLSGTTPWTYGNSVWSYPNGTGVNGDTIDWNIVRTSHNISLGNDDITLLGLIVESGELIIANPAQALNENNNGIGLWITHYLELDGFIDLIGESQLVQKRYTTTQYSESILDQDSGGYIERDQQGTQSSYNYNYWSLTVSPVSGNTSTRGTGVSSINGTSTISQILMDGTVSSSPRSDISYGGHYTYADSGSPSPIRLSNYWFWKFNGASDDYGSWIHIGSSGQILPGEGYTMKGTRGSAAILDEQNYVFSGRPNDGGVILPISNGDDRLIGNPYPSAIDANEFILDNINDSGGRRSVNVFNGALYFWDHFGGHTHVLRDYVGGYATYTLLGGVNAISNDYRINATGGTGTKIPSRYITVNQGFFVTVTIHPLGDPDVTPISGGDIYFKNSQRAFIREAVGTSIFVKQSKSKEASNNSNNGVGEEDLRPKIRLQYDSPLGYHRNLLVGVDENTTDHFDLGYDGPLNEDNAEDMYWFFDNSSFTIQGVQDFNSERELPLGIRIKESGKITIKLEALENIPENTEIYIKDYHNDGETYDIKNTSSGFEIELEAGEHTDRFALVFQSRLDRLDEIATIDDGVIIFANNDAKELVIQKTAELEFVQVTLFNYLGQVIKIWDRGMEERNIHLPVNEVSTGVYIINLQTQQGVITKKVLIE